eukprot:c8856_g1_i1.p1 GENE.c8856_g1_i1~~c8856_g1_i1.p1  ORF type:complete len:394 (+),score=142.07 c8856_g1_i1:157-1338(+)
MEEINKYLDERKVKQLFKELMEHVCLEKPTNVHVFLVKYLQENFPDAFKVAPSTPNAENNLVTIKVEADEDEGEESEEEDKKDVPKKSKPKPTSRIRRAAVSAESVTPDQLKNQKKKSVSKSDEDREKVRHALQGCVLFHGLDDESLKDLVEAVEEKRFKSGEYIMKQGDDGDYFYIIEEGEAHIYVKRDGQERKVYESKPGDFFGELALMYNAPRAASIIAAKETRCWAVDRQTFKLTLMESTINKRSRYEKFLDSVPILQPLYKYEKLTIADALEPRVYKANQIVIEQGSTHSEEFYIIEKGQVEFTQKNDKGEEVPVGQSGDGGYFGEIALLTNKPRAATVRCVSDCALLVLDRKTFVRVMGPIDDILKRNMEQYQSWMEKTKPAPPKTS